MGPTTSLIHAKYNCQIRNWLDSKSFAFIMAENTEEALFDISDLEETCNGSLSGPEILINRKQ